MDRPYALDYTLSFEKNINLNKRPRNWIDKNSNNTEMNYKESEKSCIKCRKLNKKQKQ